MTVREAGRLGGLIGGRKGGLAVKAERGVGFYQEIGKLGGQRVRDPVSYTHLTLPTILRV